MAGSHSASGAIFCGGLIEDNLRGDGNAARSAFAAPLTSAEEAGEELIVSEALRHLGYHASEAGDADRARQMWERSTEQRQRAGAVPYVLSQQLLLAGLARDGGDRDTARCVAAEVRRWAHALGIGLLESQAAMLAEGRLRRAGALPPHHPGRCSRQDRMASIAGSRLWL